MKPCYRIQEAAPRWLAHAAMLALSLATFPVRAASADNSLETIVVTGTKTNDFGAKSGIPIERMPQSVQVLDEYDIAQRGARTIEDALRAVPSATVARSRIGGFAGATLRLRGFAADQIRNGIPQRFHESTDPSALSNVGRIEVLKGPSGVLYGQSGVGGIISILTRQPGDVFEGSVAFTGGSFDQNMATLDVGGPLSDTLGLRLTSEVERSGSFTDYLDVDRENVAVTMAWRPGDRVSAHLVAEYLHRKTLNNPGLPTTGTVRGNGVATVDRSAFLGEPDYSLQENHAPLIQAWVDMKVRDGWTLTPRLQYNEWNNTGRSTTLLPPVAGQPTLIDRVGRNAGEKDEFYIAQLDLAGAATLWNLRHELLFGMEYNNDKVPFQMHGTVPCGIGAIDALNPSYGCGVPTSNFGFLSEARLEGFAFYLQDQIALTDAWHVVAGIRRSDTRNENYFNGNASGAADLLNTSWQLGTTYALNDNWSLFGGYNTGYDLGAVTGLRHMDGRPFQPETSDQAEAGLRLARDAARANLSLFRIRRNRVGVPDPGNLGFQVQEGQFRVRGVELEGEWSPLAGWWIQGGYAYLDAIVSQSTNQALVGAQLAETPRHTVTASSRVTFGAVELRAAANYVGARKLINGGTVTLPGYITFDVGAGTTLGSIHIDAVVTNVGDETYYYSDNLSRYSIGTEDRVLPGEPRTFSLRVTHTFGAAQQ